MPLISDTLGELNRLVDVFFEKIGRKERLRKQILKLMDECEAYLYPKIRDCMQLSRKQIIRDIKNRILKFEKKSKPQIIVDYVDWETIERSEMSIIKPAYLNIMEKSGNLSLAQARIEASFDVINPRSVKWAEKYSSELVTLVGKETKKGLREIVTQGVKEGKTLKGIAKDIEKMGIGLNGRQTKALYKYRDLMEAQKLPSKVIKDKFDKYYNRLLRERSEMISRTEVNRSVNEGYLDSLEGTRYEEVEISSAGDACHLCLDMAGIRYKRAEARGRLPVHPDCRCHWIVVIPRKKKPKPKVPGKPKPEALKIPRRGHLKPIRSDKELIEQFIKDAKLKGKVYSDVEATEICRSVRNFTGFDYAGIRDYQTYPAKYAKDPPSVIRHMKELSKNLETYLKYSSKYKEKIIYRGIDLTSSQFDTFKKGQIIGMQGTSSFSSSLDEARVFGDYIFRVKSQSGVSVSHISAAHFEQEILMSKNVKFKILKISRSTKDIFLEEIVPKVKKGEFNL